MSEYKHLLEVAQLAKYFPQARRSPFAKREQVYAVDGVSFHINAGETLGLVGESGCGKSTVAKTLLNLYPASAGSIFFDGRNVREMGKADLRELRKDIQMIFQDPYESLNSRHTVGEILEEPFIIHKIGTREERKQEVIQLLERVGLNADAASRFPHEFSGGQRQRIGIARAIALKPKLIVCDEPVSALDVSIQSQIINLLLELQSELNLALLFIAHDLSVVKHISDRVAVMYLGRIVEIASSEQIYSEARHPYTKALIEAIPIPDPQARHQRQVLSGDVPNPLHPPSGCHFHTRCPKAQDLCRQQSPELIATDYDANHQVACHFYHD